MDGSYKYIYISEKKPKFLNCNPLMQTSRLEAQAIASVTNG